MPLRQHPFLRLCTALGLIWLLLNLPVLLGFRVLPWDAIKVFYPVVYFNAHTLRLGLAPWWNPYIYSGFPQIADPQGMLFSPLLMTWMLLRYSPGATWFAWGVLLHLLMGGVAMLALLRRSGANAFGALVGAGVFMAGGVAASRLEHTPIVIAYCYAPVVLLALRHFMAAPGWWRGILFGVAAGAMVTQLVQVAYLFALLTVAYAAGAVAMHWNGYDRTMRLRCCAGMALAVVCALLLGMPQLLFSWAYIHLSNRPTLPLAAAVPASLDWRVLLTLLEPNALHALRGRYSGPADRVEAYLYLGTIPSLLLCSIGAAWRNAQQRRQLAFFAVVAVIASLYMFGVNTPFYGWLYRWLPGIEQFRRPSDAAFVLNFSFAIVIGLAASHFRLEATHQTRVLLEVAACWLLLSSLQMRHTVTDWQAATLLGPVIAVIALWRLRRAGSTRRTAAWLLLLLIVDYRCFNLNGTFNQVHDSAQSFMHNPAADFVVARLAMPAGTLPPRAEPVDAGVSWDDLVILRDIPSTQGYNPLRYGLYDRWYGAREIATTKRVDTPFDPAPDSKLSDLLGVAYLVHGEGNDDPRWSPPSGFSKVFAAGTTQVWQNTRAYPRLLTPVHALLLEVGQTPAPAAFAATDFRDTLWLTPRDAEDLRSDRAAAAACTSRLQLAGARSTPTKLTVHTASGAAGWLSLGELDFPGWQADADGAPLAIHRANGMFRAVCVPAGNHTLRFEFHPVAMVAEVWRHRAH